MCYACHRAIHKRHDEMELALRFNTLQALQLDPDLESHITWVKKQRVRW
ncbi:hypothetical protein [Nitrincola tapanii]|nr:hypothetical protein [Nitrincola tapanii]